VPPLIYTIPPTSPLHYVTYVRVYSSTPTTVLVGYTSGYYGTVLTSDGVVVYGTGYTYPAYVGTTVYVVQTSDGLLMIDSMGAAQVETDLLPGFRKLGLDPAQVKIIIAGHGHADHVGGSRYMQEHFGSKVYISAADWNLIENPPAARGGGAPAPPQVWPKHDQVLTEGQPVVLGDLKVMPVAIPGHTPGSMGFIFPVKDNGRTHMAALYGGTVLTPGIISDEGLATYLKSVAHFREETTKAKVDVEIQNHPLMDPIQAKLDKLAARRTGDPNPFVVGQENYQKFLDVMSLCTQVNIARRK